jgi:UDP-4-amino-4,6-dideoxy-N-acetyl-beta-L-altrosamine transaminase
MLPYGRQQITEDDIQSVVDVLRSDWITDGPVTQAFEQAFAEHVGAKYAVAVCNATAALHLAMRVANIGAGDRVVTSPNTFLASANCAAFVGATPDFSDIDARTYNLCPVTLAESWQADIRAVVPVHYAGGPADMQSIYELARERGAVVIEDACHAVGGSVCIDGELQKIGGHRCADMTTFSFHPVKTMTSGEGGMLVTDNIHYAHRARQLRSHGIVRALEETVGLGMSDYDERGQWYYEMQDLGYNMRITDFQSALGLSQLGRLESSLKRRREIVHCYNRAFCDSEHLTIPALDDDRLVDDTSWHLYTVLIDFSVIGLDRTQVMQALRDRGVATQVLYIPVYLQPYYRKSYGYGQGKCPNAEHYYQQTLSLPLYPGMSDADVQHVIDSLIGITTAQQLAA